MSARIIDGKAVAAALRSELAKEVAAFVEAHGRPPGLATVLIGDDPASAVYVGSKQRQCEEIGMRSFGVRLPADTSEEDAIAAIDELNADPNVNGIIVQLPLPDRLDGVKLTGLVDVAKDVDGLTPLSAGLLALGRPGLRPCTPSGVMLLLESAGAARGRRGGRGRPLEPVRQADGAAAARRQRDGDDVPFAHARPRRHLRARRHPHRRDRAAAAGQGRLGQAGRHRHRRRHQPHSPEAKRLVGDVDFAAAAERAGRDHARAGRGRADDDRLPAAQHADRGAWPQRPGPCGVAPG